MNPLKQAILYLHGKGGSAEEAAQYQKNCAGWDVIGVEYTALPWVGRDQILAAYREVREGYDRVALLANSLGAYFAMLALQDCALEKALLISPVLDMEGLILTMMGWAHVTEEALRERGEIPTDFGETLSWEYLTYVRDHPVCWRVPTEILCAGVDPLVPRPVVDGFVQTHRAGLTVMEDGEHWFHTDAQLAFLDRWMQRVL